MEFTLNTAKEFFWALRQASRSYLRDHSIPEDPGFKKSPWQNKRPVGITFHFTAGISGEGSIRWLNNTTNKNSSCHFVMFDREIPEIEVDYFSKYDILKEMPVTCVMLADLETATWHATWSNRLNVGIENRNAGKLRHENGKFFWWANNWKAPFLPETMKKTPIEIDGIWWEPYTVGQLLGNIILGRMLHQLYLPKGGLDPSWVLPHSAIQKEKFDTGRAFPLTEVRQAIFTTDKIADVQLPQKACMTPGSMRYDSDNFMCGTADEGDRSDQSSASEDFSEFFSPDVTYSLAGAENVQELRALQRLGYFVDPAWAGYSAYSKKVNTAVYQFQRCMGLVMRGLFTESVKQALAKRLAEFGYSKAT